MKKVKEMSKTKKKMYKAKVKVKNYKNVTHHFNGRSWFLSPLLISTINFPINLRKYSYNTEIWEI